MGKRRGDAVKDEEFLRALKKTVPDEVEQSQESVERTRSMLSEESAGSREGAPVAGRPSRGGVRWRRAAIALGALALIAVIVVLAMRPWQQEVVKKPPVSGPQKDFMLGPKDYEIFVKTKTTDQVGSRIPGGYFQLKTITVDIDARDMDSGEHVKTTCVVELKPGASEGLAPYELRFHEYPYVLRGEVKTELRYCGEEAFVFFRGAACSTSGAAFYDYNRFIAWIDLN